MVVLQSAFHAGCASGQLPNDEYLLLSTEVLEGDGSRLFPGFWADMCLF
jgi:hypothetical protein